jgi:regulator of sigma E protease
VIDESMDVESIKGEPWEFQSKNVFQKLLFITGGVLFNLLLSVIIFTGMTKVQGIYDPNPEPIIGSVVPNFPADSIGMEPEDKIIEINGIEVKSWNKMTETIHNHPDDIVKIKWVRDGIEYEKEIKTVSNKVFKENKIVTVGLIGISPVVTHRKANLIESISSGFSNTWYWLKVTVISLKMLITGEESVKNLGGPIFIAQLAGQTAKAGGISSILGLIAIISVNLALINILPIPALDGGHFVITIIESVKREPLSIKTKMIIQQVGLAIIFALVILVFFNDIMRLFR